VYSLEQNSEGSSLHHTTSDDVSRTNKGITNAKMVSKAPIVFKVIVAII
jgi:hypothetical protein